MKLCGALLLLMLAGICGILAIQAQVGHYKAMSGQFFAAAIVLTLGAIAVVTKPKD